MKKSASLNDIRMFKKIEASLREDFLYLLYFRCGQADESFIKKTPELFSGLKLWGRRR